MTDRATSPAWTPDGKRLLLSWEAPDQTRPDAAFAVLGTVAQDGSDPRPIIQCPLPKRLSWWGTEGIDAYWMEPQFATYSPDGSQIAFLCAWHVLPEEGRSSDRELYVMNADGTHLRRVTFDADVDRCGVSWRGPNTSPDHRGITVNNTSVLFSSVTREGVTTITWNGAPPVLPPGYRLCSDCYDLSTTAAYSGPVAITMTYEGGRVSADQRETLALLRWDGAAWKDITTFGGGVHDTVRGKTDSLSPHSCLAVAVRQDAR